jgi:DNA recombination protein RmuC
MDMMDLTLPSFAVQLVIALVLAVAYYVLVRNAAHGASLAAQEQLGSTERRLLDALERLRGSTEGTLREGHQALAKVETDVGLRLQAAVDESRVATARDIETRSGTLCQLLSNTLADARREHTDRIERLETAVTGMVTTVLTGSEETKTAQAESARDQARTYLAASDRLRDTLSETLSQLRDALTLGQQQAVKELVEVREVQGRALAAVQANLHADLTAVRQAQTEAAADLRDRLQANLEAVRKDTEDKLERIRATVDERLQTTLESRLGESFKLVSERLEQVHRGLGEVQALASGVGDLKRILTNVRSRGVFSEVQLRALLEEVFTPEQYDENVATIPGSSERVEFAIKLPGPDGEGCVHLPIDAKFPLEDYQRLQEAFEKADSEAVELSRKALRRRALAEAETIHRKYVAPPLTTEFALMFVATEGIYAEILRIPGLHEEMQRVHRVVAVGPTTLQALLTSLQMGFRTLAIERRSAEVWKVLAAVKTEFGKFGGALDAVGKKIHEAGDRLDEVSKRSRVMQRKLRAVEALPQAEASQILEVPTPEGEDGLRSQ